MFNITLYGEQWYENVTGKTGNRPPFHSYSPTLVCKPISVSHILVAGFAFLLFNVLQKWDVLIVLYIFTYSIWLYFHAHAHSKA